MGEEDTRRMVRAILKSSLVAEAPGAKGSNQTGTPPLRTPDAARPPESPVGTPTTQPTGTDLDIRTPPAAVSNLGEIGSPALQRGVTPKETRPITDLAPESLGISQTEVDFMAELAPLLGRSPRTLKRFVNVYRLIKVGLSAYERHVFLSDAGTVPDYRAVLCLLAIDTGAPQLARPFFVTVRDLSAGRVFAPASEDGGQQRYMATLENLISLLDRDRSVGAEPDWLRVRAWLQPAPQKYRFPNDVTPFGRWVPHVSRFSFHTGRI
jgi:hypothetical protein